ADWQQNPNAAAGSIIGAGLGALVGSQFGAGTGALAATGGGTLLGAAIGNQAGASVDNANRAYQAAAVPVVVGPPAYGAPAPIRRTGECREFQQTIIVGGQRENAYGTACRQADGSWRVVP